MKILYLCSQKIKKSEGEQSSKSKENDLQNQRRTIKGIKEDNLKN